ncbi:solute carrier family 26 member 10-like [Topomyia yanbarensis]|uniref:solute carrier family 26 member 10-like n=1 Tax=Topomyia yanbarensis TaxID=2498891 RepID=UPI00273AD02A|nr:solute carrier family 26 member 10-like [Topomyia yanbarensis]
MAKESFDTRCNSGGTENGHTNNGFCPDAVPEEENKPNKKFSVLPPVTVARPHYHQEELNNEMNYSKPKRRMTDSVLSSVKGFSVMDCVKSVFPIVRWMSEYSWKQNFLADLISGCTVAVMHIPQGMGYAMLAYVPPIVGLYMAFFPVMVYFFLGTSRHNSMGTFAVISILVGKTVLEYSTAGVGLPGHVAKNSTLAGLPGEEVITRGPIEVAATLCFAVGLWQVLFYLCRVGTLSFLLSDTLISGFTTGAAIYVFTSQVNLALGIPLPPIVGTFKIIRTYAAIFAGLSNVNHIAVFITTSTILILILNIVFLKPRVAKFSVVPVPVELIILIIGSLLSTHYRLREDYGIKTIVYIPTGFPEPTLPDFDLLESIILDSFVVAVVSYAVTVSMGAIFAQRENYELDFNQELLAMGSSNLFGCFFSCMPFSASLSRSMVQYLVGGRTQISSIVSCCILAAVLMYIGPFFEPLPVGILSGIIMVALRGPLMQVTQFIDFWRLSSIDAVVWMGTFLTTVLVSIDIGLLVGAGLSICSIFIRGMKSYTCVLENVANTDLYLDTSRYKGTIGTYGVKIFHFSGSLNFATRSSYKTSLLQALNLDITQELKLLSSSDDESKTERDLRYLVLDFTRVSDVDPSAVSSLKTLINEFEKLSVKVLIAGASCPVYEMMRKCKLVGSDEREYCRVFPTVHDAVVWARNRIIRYPGKTSIAGTKF